MAYRPPDVHRRLSAGNHQKCRPGVREFLALCVVHHGLRTNPPLEFFENPTPNHQLPPGGSRVTKSHLQLGGESSMAGSGDRFRHGFVEYRRYNAAVDDPGKAFPGRTRCPPSLDRSVGGPAIPDPKSAGVVLAANKACGMRARQCRRTARSRRDWHWRTLYAGCRPAIPDRRPSRPARGTTPLRAVCASVTKRLIDLHMWSNTVTHSRRCSCP